MKLTLEDVDRMVRLHNGATCYLSMGNFGKQTFRGRSKGKPIRWDKSGICISSIDPDYNILEFVYPRPREITEKDIGRNVILWDGRIATITELARYRTVRGTCNGVPVEWHTLEHQWVSSSPTHEYGIASFIEDPPPPTGT